jgi:hypothetical protein
MNTKENWLIAWSAIRLNNSILDHLYTSYEPRISKEVKSILPIAIKCFITRETWKVSPLKGNLEIHVKNNGFRKEWTGWKYTWVKFEEKDVPF